MNNEMYDPDFDPLKDLHNLMLAVATQHQQIDLLMQTINSHNIAIKNINNALNVTKKQLIYLEKRLYEINTTATSNRERRE